jgi:glycerate kinase
MKQPVIIIAPDSFKDGATSTKLCRASVQAIKKQRLPVTIETIPLADGGEGTASILSINNDGKRIRLAVTGPLFEKVTTGYGLCKESKTAFIDCASASGIHLIPSEQRNPVRTTTYGTGEIIKDAILKGATNISLAIGGSATNDCGCGMAAALGTKFADKQGKRFIPTGGNLNKVYSIDFTELKKNIHGVKFKILCDVNNPLYGKSGAAYVYAQQKGANEEEVMLLDNNLKHFSKIMNAYSEKQAAIIAGSGAAGGLGAAGIWFLNGKIIPGISYILKTIQFEKKIRHADLIITGEGQLDSQTNSGKVISGICNIAKKHHIPVVALCGSVEAEKKIQHKIGLIYAASIQTKPVSLQDALQNTVTNFANAAAQTAALFSAGFACT